jgi:hypothetical protein
VTRPITLGVHRDSTVAHELQLLPAGEAHELADSVDGKEIDFLMLEPSCAASKNPYSGIVPFQTPTKPRMLASGNMEAVGEGRTSRSMCGLDSRRDQHWRLCMAA